MEEVRSPRSHLPEVETAGLAARAELLEREYALGVELASLVLLAAIIVAIVLSPTLRHLIEVIGVRLRELVT